MSMDDWGVADLVRVVSRAKVPSVAERIERRIELLSQWLQHGVPPGKTIPLSLNKAREWDDAELGITPIGSAGDFVTTNKTHGSRIEAFDKLRKMALKRYGLPPGNKKQGRGQTPNTSSTKMIDRTISDLHITAAVSQWHSERDQRLAEQARANAAEGRSIQLLQENAERDVLIADLRRQLASHRGLRAVE
jgi:hypothetical protein